MTTQTPSPSEKPCKSCGVEKPDTEFYPKDSKCKTCRCAMVRANRLARLDQYREYERARWQKPERKKLVYASLKKNAQLYPERYLGYKRAYSARHPERRAESSRAYIASYPKVYASHIKVGNALRAGVLKKQPCEKCGAARSYAHHDDYDKPLAVRWLCSLHHAEWHRINGPGANYG